MFAFFVELFGYQPSTHLGWRILPRGYRMPEVFERRISDRIPSTQQSRLPLRVCILNGDYNIFTGCLRKLVRYFSSLREK